MFKTPFFSFPENISCKKNLIFAYKKSTKLTLGFLTKKSSKSLIFNNFNLI